MQKRYRSYPCVDASLVETRAKFGIPVQQEMTDEDKEIASRFDVHKELEKALEQRRTLTDEN